MSKHKHVILYMGRDEDELFGSLMFSHETGFQHPEEAIQNLTATWAEHLAAQLKSQSSDSGKPDVCCIKTLKKLKDATYCAFCCKRLPSSDIRISGFEILIDTGDAMRKAVGGGGLDFTEHLYAAGWNISGLNSCQEIVAQGEVRHESVVVVSNYLGDTMEYTIATIGISGAKSTPMPSMCAEELEYTY